MTKAFVCRCEDVPFLEVVEAIEHGFDDLESLRRYTAVGTGPCQGKACLAECARLLADKVGAAEGDLGLWTMRPPLVPIPLGLLAALPDDIVAQVVDSTEAGPPRSIPKASPEPKTPKGREARIRKGGRL